jgi:hypothetical protein
MYEELKIMTPIKFDTFTVREYDISAIKLGVFLLHLLRHICQVEV